MPATVTQSTRNIAVFTPLGADVLLLRRFKGREELSRPFRFELEMLSYEDRIQPAEIVGQPVSFVVDQREPRPRFFHGWVTEFRHSGREEPWNVYHAVVRPWLWFLTQTADCRIFQKKNVLQIVEKIFSDLGFSDYDSRFVGSQYAEREYCVQYRETDFDFVSRLLEEEGIFYYFRHDQEKHTLVLADRTAAYFEIGDADVDYSNPQSMQTVRDRILKWEHRYEFRPGRWAQTDYDFKRPPRKLMTTETTTIGLRDNKNYEIYDYPGRYTRKQHGASLTRIRMEEEDAQYNLVHGQSTYRTFAPGGSFKVHSHHAAAEVGQAYTLVAVEHTASVQGSYDDSPNLREAAELEEEYENRFTCLPKSVLFRPRRITPKAIVRGSQTAVVVGPPGEEIYPDEHGRVKVQFHWDREGQYDENSSCWIRVSQVHAGKGWGGIDLPRIGEEVIVDFLEGDPDAPIITGRVYNGDNQPPFALPAEKTRSGMKSQTHKGAGFNEISMDDTAGAEQIRIHGQYNMDTAVNNNQTLKVGVDRTSQIGNNDTTKIGNDASESVGHNKSLKVANNMNTNVGSKLVVNAGSSITLKCGASRIHMNAGGVITITGTIITLAAAANAAVAAPLTQVIGGAMLTTIGGINMLEGGVTHVGAAALCSVSGGKVDVAGGQTSIKGAPIKLN